MTLVMNKLSVLAYVLAVFFGGTVQAEDFLQTAETLWFDATSAPKVSAHIELRGLSQADAQALISKEKGLTATVTKRVVDGRPQGIVISFENVGADQLTRLDTVWQAMTKAGAKSTWSDQPAQVRIKIVPPTGITGAANTKALEAMTSNLRNPVHFKQIQDFDGTPKRIYDQTGPTDYDVMLNVQDGSLAKPLRQAMGVYQISAKAGAIDHDNWVMSTTGVNVEGLAEMRTAFLKKRRGESTQPVVTRYLLGDPKNIYNEGTRYILLKPDYLGPLAVMRADQQGERPLILRPGSAVWHSRVHHQNNIMGDLNPALINGDLSALMTSNKYFEALWFNKYLPGAMSRTELLEKVIKKDEVDPQDIDRLLATLGKQFPKGWVLKAVKESNTGTFIITDKLDIKKLVEDYRKSDFDKHFRKVMANSAGQDEDIITEKLQKHPAYMGWKIAQFLKDPRMVIAQERVEIKTEFRVEAIAGRVLSAKSTVDRYADKWVASEKQLPFVQPPEVTAKVEAYVQDLLNKLPPELRGTGFAFDVALLKDGSLTVIESNAGPESGYLMDYVYSVAALDRFLRNFDRLAKEGKVTPTGLNAKQMTAYLDGLLTEWHLDPEIHWPHAKVHRTYDGKRKNAVEIAFDRSTRPAESYVPQPPPKGANCDFKSLITPETAAKLVGFAGLVGAGVVVPRGSVKAPERGPYAP